MRSLTYAAGAKSCRSMARVSSGVRYLKPGVLAEPGAVVRRCEIEAGQRRVRLLGTGTWDERQAKGSAFSYWLADGSTRAEVGVGGDVYSCDGVGSAVGSWVGRTVELLGLRDSSVPGGAGTDGLGDAGGVAGGGGLLAGGGASGTVGEVGVLGAVRWSGRAMRAATAEARPTPTAARSTRRRVAVRRMVL